MAMTIERLYNYFSDEHPRERVVPLELQPVSIANDLKRRARSAATNGALVIGLINNMPDSALASTEAQFTALLTAAAGDRPICLRLASLPKVPRGLEARAHIAKSYWNLEQLFEQPPDAIIVTGTEPKAAVLSDEPYWESVVALIEYADANLISSAWSCLAAHAAVLHLDGITRKRLETKRFGIFDQRVRTAHALTQDLGPQIRTPHSRWNDVSLGALEAAGYQVLTQSAQGDADLFVKQRQSLLVFFQGHPEYEERTLLKEYQRDVGRFIAGDYRNFPNPPLNYFGSEALTLLTQFERRVRGGEFAEPMAEFPFAALAASLQSPWVPAAARIYANWLGYLAAEKYCARGR
jgi:homoserine O-succinyltransferase